LDFSKLNLPDESLIYRMMPEIINLRRAEWGMGRPGGAMMASG
jgi:hypothetical protein